MRKRIATEPSGPLHPYNDVTARCVVCGKPWLQYMECGESRCYVIYCPGNGSQPQETERQPRTVGRWATLFDEDS